MTIQPNTVHLKDCFELLKGIGDKTADLVLLDPNYQDWDDLIAKGIIEEARRLLKPTGNILLFTKKPYDLNLRVKVDPIFRNEIIWKYKKNGNWYSTRMPIYTYQKIYWCCGESFFYNQQTGIPQAGEEEQAMMETMTLGQFVGYRLDEPLWSCEGRYRGGRVLKDFLDIPRSRENKTIPTKPIELCQILLRCFCPVGGLVVDPFMGGGNFILTAHKEGRQFIGGDIDESCFRLANEKVFLNL